MPALDNIRFFLARARRRARAEATTRYLVVATAVAVIVVLGLALTAAATGPAAFWPTLTALVLLGITLSAFALVVLKPWRQLRSDASMADLVGKAHPPIASDLRSAVELGAAAAPDSPTLVDAFTDTVAERCKQIDLASIIPLRRLARASLLLVAFAGAGVLVGLTWPDVVGHGLRLLTRKPTLFEGATVSREPLVGDVRITYHYPTYTRLPPRTVTDSSGEILALRGTRVELEMRTLRSARRALLLFGDQGERGEVQARLDKDKLRAQFVVKESGRYRVWLAPLIGKPLREDRGHRIEAAADQPPVVDIKGPADRLELPAPRPIEIGFGASDDYGLGPIELVFRVGNAPEKRVLLEDAAGVRQAQGRTVWDPSQEALVPGVQIAYRVEAHDRDEITGGKAGDKVIGKVGSSRTLFIVLERPRESFDESIENQRQILDGLLKVLADRLELPAALEALAAAGLEATIDRQRVAALQSIHDDEQAEVARLGHLIVEQKRSESAAKSLLAALTGIADRLTNQLRDEQAGLQRARDATARGRSTGPDWRRLQDGFARHIDALEESALLLDDLIGRQRLEDLAGLSRQLGDAYQRLQELLQRYNATKDEALREQLLREIQELQRRIGELASKVAEIKQRNEVSTEWQNMPDLDQAMKQAGEVEDLIKKGDNASLEQALAELGKALESLNQMLEGNADEFAQDRFPRESRAMNELNRQISDIEGDERQLASDTDELASGLEQAMGEQQRQQIEQAMKGMQDRLGQLNQKLAGAPPGRAGETASDDHARAQEHAGRAERLMKEKDITEVKDELDQAAQNLEHLQRSVRRRVQQDGQDSQVGKFAGEMQQAEQLAEQLSQEMSELAQQMQSIASAEQRAKAGQQAARQGGIGDRTRKLAEQARREGEGLPGFDRAQQQLEQASRDMQRAQDDLGRGDVRSALGRERAAIERLSNLRESMNNERMGRSSRHREPVRIPGADDSQAPRAWRQELMEAMREKGPEPFREEVRRYYEELVK